MNRPTTILFTRMMKKALFLVLIIFVIIANLHGQENRFSIGLIGSLESNKYDFKSTGFNNDYDYTSLVGYSYGLGAKYVITGNLFIKSGMTIYSHGYSVKYNYIFMDEGDPSMPRQTDLTVSYFRIPLKIGLKVLDVGEFSFNPSIGLNTALQISTDEKTTYEDNAQKESSFLSDQLNTTQLGINLDLGIEYGLNPNFRMVIIPYVSKGLNKLNNHDMESGQVSMGGLLGLYYNF